MLIAERRLCHPQIADMHHDGAVGDVEIRLAPHGFVDDLHREDALGALHHQLEDFVLGLGQVGLLLVHPDPTAVQCDAHAVPDVWVILYDHDSLHSL